MCSDTKLNISVLGVLVNKLNCRIEFTLMRYNLKGVQSFDDNTGTSMMMLIIQYHFDVGSKNSLKYSLFVWAVASSKTNIQSSLHNTAIDKVTKTVYLVSDFNGHLSTLLQNVIFTPTVNICFCDIFQNLKPRLRIAGSNKFCFYFWANDHLDACNWFDLIFIGLLTCCFFRN